MIVEMLVIGMFQENSYVAGCEKSKGAMVVDPGDDAEVILVALDRLGLTVELIVVTPAST
jgi:glyoxylase-like metal-dependent hydrolase (beta-lactamase superfamily II)